MTNDQFEQKMRADLEAAKADGNREAAGTLETALALWTRLSGPERRRFRRDYQRRKATRS